MTDSSRTRTMRDLQAEIKRIHDNTPQRNNDLPQHNNFEFKIDTNDKHVDYNVNIKWHPGSTIRVVSSPQMVPVAPTATQTPPIPSSGTEVAVQRPRKQAVDRLVKPRTFGLQGVSDVVDTRLAKLLKPNSDPKLKHLQPLFDWGRYTKETFRSEMASTEAIPFILMFSTFPAGMASLFLIDGGLGVLALAIDTVSVGLGAYFFGSGFVERAIEKRVDKQVEVLSEQHLRAWLKHNFGVVPGRRTFEDVIDDVVRVVNDGGDHWYGRSDSFKFVDETGRSYTLERDSKGANLHLSYTRGWRDVPRVSQTLPFKPRATDEELLAFPRRERIRVTAARDLINAHKETELPVEVRFGLDRAETMLTETVALAKKISMMPAAEQKQGYRELATVLDTITTELTDLDLNQHKATLRQAKILARYSRNIRKNQANPLLDL